jgi:hypothetical protein
MEEVLHLLAGWGMKHQERLDEDAAQALNDIEKGNERGL